MDTDKVFVVGTASAVLQLMTGFLHKPVLCCNIFMVKCHTADCVTGFYDGSVNFSFNGGDLNNVLV
jgi:hypothetical protein